MSPSSSEDMSIGILDLSNGSSTNCLKIDLLVLKYKPLGLNIPKPWIEVLKNQIDVVGSLINPWSFTW